MAGSMPPIQNLKAPASMRIVGNCAKAPRGFRVILTVTAEKPPYSRPLGDGRHVLRADAAALGVDLAQGDQHLLGHDVARDALALGLELVHVDPHGIDRRRAARADPW